MTAGEPRFSGCSFAAMFGGGAQYWKKLMVLSLIPAVLAINAMLVVGVADYITERNELEALLGRPSAPEVAEAVSGM